ncbi:MAG TPA: rhomboid family intramembrane serine protease [Thermoanaerobaculia bacterium]|nr:rhomboid family intramembrane serine protease [Thermoanaerobaculia bacterium]
MIPLRDTLPTRIRPRVNHALIVSNLLVFAAQVFTGQHAEVYIRAFGFTPARFFHPASFGDGILEVSVTLVTSLFMHGGLLHIGGNLLYLWIFGDNVEERLGHGKYLLFFIACGTAGSLTHAFFFPLSEVPSIGASGCIAGVLGAYLVLFPHARIVTFFPLIVYWALAELPAIVLLPIWFVMQFLNGWLSLASAQGVQEVTGVAWWAHIGGFLFGAAVGLWVRAGRDGVGSR